MYTTLQEILLHMSRNRLRTVLTGFAVGWGVLLLIVLLGIGTGFENSIRAQVEETGMLNNTVTIRLQTTSIPYAGFEANRKILFDGEEDIALIRSVAPEIAQIVPINQRKQPIRKLYANATVYNKYASLVATSPDYFEFFFTNPIIAGRALIPGDESRSQHHCLLPGNIASTLFQSSEKAIGNIVYIDGFPLAVVGVYKNYNNWESNIYIPLQEMERFSNNTPLKHRRFALQMKPDFDINEKNLDLLQEKLSGVFSRKYLFNPRDKKVIRLDSPLIDIKKDLLPIFWGLRTFLWIMGLSILSIGVVGVSNIMLVTVSERKKEIGIRKALGARSSDILKLILGESVFITIISGLIGFITAILLLLLLVYFTDVKGMASLTLFGEKAELIKNPLISLPIGFLSIAVMAVAGCIAGYVPSRKAAQISPIDAMREQ